MASNSLVMVATESLTLASTGEGDTASPKCDARLAPDPWVMSTSFIPKIQSAMFGNEAILVTDDLAAQIRQAQARHATNEDATDEGVAEERKPAPPRLTRGDDGYAPPPPLGTGGLVDHETLTSETEVPFAVDLQRLTGGKALFCTPSVFPEVIAASAVLPETSVSVSGLGSHLSGKGPLGQVARRAAELRGADGALVSVAGSTLSNLVVLRAVAHGRPGRGVLMARNVHHSMVNGATAFGVPLRFLCGQYTDPTFESVLAPDPTSVAEALERGVEPAAIIITSPSYEGVVADVAGIAEVIRELSPGTLLVIDQAWGAHLGVAGLPPSAISQGADVVIESTHKLGGAPNQAGLLLWNNRSGVGPELCAAYRQLATTSPSFPLIASLDMAVRLLHSAVGARHLGDVRARTTDLRSRLRQLGLVVSGSEVSGRPVDPCRLNINVKPTGRSGFGVAEELEALGIVVEKAGLVSVMVIVTFQLASDAEDRLVAALGEMMDEAGNAPTSVLPALACQDLPEAPDPCWDPVGPSVRVPLREAAGHVAAEIVECFPPGIPFLVPGFSITQAMVDYLEAILAAGGTISWDDHATVAVQASRVRV